MNKDKRDMVFLGVTIVALLCAAVFLERYTSTQEKDLSKTTTFGILNIKPIKIYERPEFSSEIRCGNGFCEYEIGETPLSCPEDCPV